jgi:hypothetical protein
VASIWLLRGTFPSNREHGRVYTGIAAAGCASTPGSTSQMAGNVVAGQDLAHLGLLLRATIEGVGATGVKAAARRRADRVRQIALQDDAFSRLLRVGHRYGRQERRGVRVLRAGEECPLIDDLDDLAERLCRCAGPGRGRIRAESGLACPPASVRASSATRWLRRRISPPLLEPASIG